MAEKNDMKKDIIDALMKINDPEIMIDVWTLGLIYNVDVKDGKVNIRMTFTTPMCPYGPMLLQDIKYNLGKLPGVKGVDIEVTFDPPWQPSEELRTLLGV